jgi:voltage-gated potassium channel
MRNRAAWRLRLHTIIFGHETPAGKAFDVALILLILASVIVVMLDSVAGIRARYGVVLRTFEWVFTVLFTVEYVLRLLSAHKAARYARSFFGLIDLVSVLPSYISVILPGSQYFAVVRILRVLRVFRVLKMAQYVGEAAILVTALRQARTKIILFTFTVLTIVVIVGSLLYLIEGPPSGFDNIPRSMYWAIVTLTTVGYGDIAPRTPVGQALASIVMLLGYAIIAVPTGIMTVELANAGRAARDKQCPLCRSSGHDADALHCKKCGTVLVVQPP